jgi:choline dehydrogenase-like flavoprotein
MSDPETDVIVIGSGAGGAAISHSLCQHGLRVVLLEAGPRYAPGADYRLHLSDWETTHFPHKIPTSGRQTFFELQTLSPRWQSLRSWKAPWALPVKRTGSTLEPCA